MIRLIVLSLIFFTIAGRALGQFTHVIHDNRLLSLSLKDKLGFGYDEAANHIFSSCLDFASRPDRSYNLSSYSYVMDEDFDLLHLVEHSAYRHQIFKFIYDNDNLEHEWDPELGRKVGIIKVLFYVKMQSLQYVADAAYKIRPAPRTLLERGDWEGFFRLCGSSFINNFTKGASYLTILSYRALGDDDEYFLERLKQNIHRLYEPQVDDPDFEQQIRRRRLRVTDLSLGLPNLPANKQSLDLDSFRKRLLLVHSLMTYESAGLVETVEINPWHEYASFIEHIPWEDHQSWQNIALLAHNGRFISKMHVKEKNMQTRVQTAELCTNSLRHDFPVGQNPDQYDPELTFFLHHKNPDPMNNISLKEFRNKLLKGNLIGKIKKHFELFKKGNDNLGTKGLKACLNILRSNFMETYYDDIPACVGAQTFPDLRQLPIEAYCLPQLAQ